MQMKSIFSRPFKYGGAWVMPHAEFSVKSVRDSKVLEVAKRAVKVAAKPAPKKTATPEAATKQTTYKRRDIAPGNTVVMRPPAAQIAAIRPVAARPSEVAEPAAVVAPVNAEPPPADAAAKPEPTGDE
jgi:hypothetical protein